MSEEELYSFCISEVGIQPSKYWKLTRAETIALVSGYVTRESNHSANFRRLYALILTLLSKEKFVASRDWPLPTDYEKKQQMGEEERNEMYKRNAKILQSWE